MEPIELVQATEYHIVRTDYYQSGNIGPEIITEEYQGLRYEEALNAICDLYNDATANNKNFTVIYNNMYTLITMDLTPVVTGMVVSKFQIRETE